MNVDTSLELANHKVLRTLGGMNTLDGEATNERRGLAGELLGVSVPGLEIERLLAVEGKNLGGGEDVALVEDNEAGVLIGNVGILLPGELDRVVDDVLDLEVADLEDRGEDSAAESAATGNSLILVHGERKLLAEESLDALLDGGDTRATTDDLDDVDIVLGELGVGEGLLERNVDLGEEGLNHGLELLAGDHGADIDVVHEGLDVERSLLVGRKNLLELLGSGEDTADGLGVGEDVNLVFAKELLMKMVEQSLVEVAATKVTVAGGGLDGKLALLELDNGAGVVGVADIDKGDSPGLLLGAGKVEFCDAPAESGSGGVVDEAEGTEAGNLGGIQDAPALLVGEPGGDAQDELLDGDLDLSLGGLLDLAHEHGDELCGGKLALLAEVGDLGTDLTIDVDQGGGDELLLNGDIGVVESAAGEALEAADGVLQVGDLLGLGGLTDIPALGAKANERRSSPVGDFVCDLSDKRLVSTWSSSTACMEALSARAKHAPLPLGDRVYAMSWGLGKGYVRHRHRGFWQQQ